MELLKTDAKLHCGQRKLYNHTCIQMPIIRSYYLKIPKLYQLPTATTNHFIFTMSLQHRIKSGRAGQPRALERIVDLKPLTTIGAYLHFI